MHPIECSRQSNGWTLLAGGDSHTMGWLSDNSVTKWPASVRNAQGKRQRLEMTEQPPAHEEKFKAEMPQIPGVSSDSRQAKGIPGPIMVIAGLAAVVIAIVLVGGMISRSHRQATAPA